MEKNMSYDYIIHYLKDNKDGLLPEEKKFLIEYASIIKKNNIENVEKISKEDIIKDLKLLTDHMEKSDETSAKIKRSYLLFQILRRIEKGEDLIDISYSIDKLFIENGMSVRDKSAVVSKLKKELIQKSK